MLSRARLLRSLGAGIIAGLLLSSLPNVTAVADQAPGSPYVAAIVADAADLASISVAEEEARVRAMPLPPQRVVGTMRIAGLKGMSVVDPTETPSPQPVPSSQAGTQSPSPITAPDVVEESPKTEPSAEASPSGQPSTAQPTDPLEAVTLSVEGAATGGSISGTVVRAGDGSPVPDGYACALSPDGGIAYCVDTDAATGAYVIPSIPAGDYRVLLDSDDPAFVSEYYDNVTTSADATLVAVTDGGTASGIDAALDEGATVSGVVTRDSDGAPAGGVSVCAVQSSPFLYGCATTDAGTGAYTIGGLQAGTYRVSYMPSGPGLASEYYDNVTDYASATPVVVATGGAVTGIDASLAAGGSISGTMTRSGSGEPVTGAMACATAVVGAFSVCFGANPATGAYQILGLAPGSYRVRFDSSDPAVIDEYYDDVMASADATPVTVAAGVATTGINAELSSGSLITGQVTRAAGGPYPAGTVCAFDVTWSTQTCGAMNASSGSYALGIAPGSYYVYFSPTDPLLRPEYYANAFNGNDATPVVVGTGATASGIDATLETGSSISGTITVAGGGAVPEGSVCLEPIGWSGTICRSADPATGAYLFPGLQPGSYKVRFSGDASVAMEYYDNAADAADATPVVATSGVAITGINAVLGPPGSITGTVTRASDGAVIPGSQACAYGLDRTYLKCVDVDPSTGAYSLTGLPLTQVKVRYWATGSEWQKYIQQFWAGVQDWSLATPIDLESDPSATGIDAELQLGGTISGTITKATGSGIPLGARACVSYDNGLASYGFCDNADPETGEYTITGLPVASYKVLLTSDDPYLAGEYYSNADYDSATPVAVTAGSAIEGIDAALDGAGAITGTITKESDGSDLPQSYACAENVATLNGYCSSTGTGAYTIGRLPAGTYKVRFATYESGYAEEYYDDVAESGSATLVTVVAGVATPGIDAALAPPVVGSGVITGTITKESDGSVIPDSYACASTIAGAFGGCGFADPVTGEYQITGLDAGTYSVFFASYDADLQWEYFDDVLDYQQATPVTVTSGATTSGISAALGAVPGPPSAPTALRVRAGNQELLVSWSPPEDEGASPVTGYTARAFALGEGGDPVAECTTSGTSCSLQGLANGTQYWVEVLAENFNGLGPATAPRVSGMPAPQVPSGPQGFGALPGDRSAVITFYPSLSDGGSPITTYEARAYDLSTGGTLLKTCTATVPSETCTLKGLTNGVEVWVAVRARNAVGWSVMVGREAVTAVAPITVPGVPRSLSITAANASATAKWTPPSSDGGSTITQYEVRAYDAASGGSLVRNCTAAPPTTECTLTGLTNGTTYYVAVRARNGIGWGAMTAREAVAPRATAPGVPRSVAFTPGDRQATGTWTAPSTDGGSAITQYEARLYDLESGGTLLKTCTSVAPSRTCTATGLTNGTTYWVAVRARNAVGWGAMSARVSVTPVAALKAPSAPTSVILSPLNGQAAVSWGVPLSDGGSPISQYEVRAYSAATAGTLVKTCTSLPPATTCTLTGLTNGTTYYVAVRARNAIGWGAFTARDPVTPTSP
jgi:hypothetical protein